MAEPEITHLEFPGIAETNSQAIVHCDALDLLWKIAERFSGFSLERRIEWKNGPYRVRVLPNKQERQDYRIEVYGKTLRGVIDESVRLIEEIDKSLVP